MGSEAGGGFTPGACQLGGRKGRGRSVGFSAKSRRRVETMVEPNRSSSVEATLRRASAGKKDSLRGSLHKVEGLMSEPRNQSTNFVVVSTVTALGAMGKGKAGVIPTRSKIGRVDDRQKADVPHGVGGRRRRKRHPENGGTTYKRPKQIVGSKSSQIESIPRPEAKAKAR